MGDGDDRTSPAEFREEAQAIAHGERQSLPPPAAPLFASVSRDALDWLRVLLRERPATVTALVALTGRAQPNVSQPLQLKHRLIREVRERREVRPEPIANAVRVDLATGTNETITVEG